MDTISGNGDYLECCYFSIATCSACLNKPSTTITNATAIHGKNINRDTSLVFVGMEAGDSNYNDNFSDYSEDFEEEEEAPESEVCMSARPSAVPMLSIPQRLRGEPARNTKSHPSPKIKTDKATWRSRGERTRKEF